MVNDLITIENRFRVLGYNIDDVGEYKVISKNDKVIVFNRLGEKILDTELKMQKNIGGYTYGINLYFWIKIIGAKEEIVISRYKDSVFRLKKDEVYNENESAISIVDTYSKEIRLINKIDRTDNFYRLADMYSDDIGFNDCKITEMEVNIRNKVAFLALFNKSNSSLNYLLIRLNMKCIFKIGRVWLFDKYMINNRLEKISYDELNSEFKNLSNNKINELAYYDDIENTRKDLIDAV